MTGEELKRKLSPMGKTAAQWADVIGVSDKTIYRMYNAQDVRTDMVERFCRVLGKPITFLYGGDNDTRELTESFTGNSPNTAVQEKPSPQPCTTKQTYALEQRVKTLLEEKRMRMSDLCRHIGMTEAGMRRMLAVQSCTNTTLIKIADFLDLPVTELLPYDPRAAEEEAKAKQIHFLKGQIDVYKTTLATLMLGEANAGNKPI